MTLPPGFRFHPTDDELVGYYLKRRVDNLKIELEVIPVIDLYKCEPWELPGTYTCIFYPIHSVFQHATHSFMLRLTKKCARELNFSYVKQHGVYLLPP